MKNTFKRLSGNLKSIFTTTAVVAGILLSPIAHAELANDPFIRDGVTDRKNFEPGGKYHLFGSARGTVTNQGGKINIDTLNHLKVGNLDIEQGIIHGEITYNTAFSGHGWEVHAPFDEHASRSKSDKNDILGVSSTAYAIEWTGDLKHPADGYDGPIGGGYPTPTGARDEYTYKVKGIADSVEIVLPEQPSFTQRLKNRGSNAWNSLKNLGNAWDKATTHNPNLNGWGNLAEAGNAALEGAGSVLNVPWELVGGNEAIEGLGVARDAAIMLELNRASPETQLSEVDWLVQGKLGYDGLKESYERWEAENPNAAEMAGLGWNMIENVLTKGKGNDKLNAKGKNDGLSAKPDIKKINDKYLEQKGIDAHQLKADFLGTSGSNAHYDLYDDNKTKEIMIYKKGGKGEGIGTGQYIK
ncbi:MAG: MafB family polymorphic toxin [Neisseriaceae bacterium]|nr:MafB family polymorphic toxin [Neisseriaceae bacterium]